MLANFCSKEPRLLLKRQLGRLVSLGLFVVPLLWLSGCSNTRYLAEGETLYTGHNVEVKSEKPLPDKKVIEGELDNIIRPDPNFSILGLRPTLWIYNIMGNPPRERGIRHWIKMKVGEPPVLLEQVRPELNVTLMENRLHNRGYFTPKISYEVQEKNRRASMDYVAQVVEPYRINEIIFPQGDTVLNRAIRETQINSRLKPGDPYNLAVLIAERERIDAELKEKGFFYFNPDFIIFRVDSTLRNRTLDVYVQVKDEAPNQARVPYTINNVIIDTNFSIGNDSLDLEEGVRVNGFYYFPDEQMFKSKNVLYSVFLQKGDLYTRRNHRLTLSRLMGLNVFQYVNARFTEADSMGSNQLDAHLFLTPALKKNLRVELQGVTKSTGFAGPGIQATFRNRNALGGAELLNVTVTGSYETQINSGAQRLTSFEIGANADLQVPRFMTPFNLPNIRSEFVPRTRFLLGFNFLNRVQYFQMNSYNASYGYIYRPHRFITHDLTLANLQYVHVFNTDSVRFDQRVQQNPFLLLTFQNQAIIGSIYNFTYNTQVDDNRRHHFFLNGNVDVSGNLVSLIKSATTSEPSSPEEPLRLLGSPFSQYARTELDFRYYFRPRNRNNSIAYRLITAAGIPYGNSRTLPYIKQFFIGGPNSIRAFRARSIGPGGYLADPSDPFSFFEQSGEIKFETNLEYRFGLVPFLKGAVFVDAGNIWMTGRSAEDIRGGIFEFKNFLTDLAVGTGFGVRVDAQFLVVRFDLGIPVRIPSYPEGERTVITEFAPLSPAWRRQNLILNIAIGYPF